MQLDELEGGKAVLTRMLQAYGFSMQKELGDLYGLSSGTISTWVRRDYFPGDVVVACALDTGVSLRWLATGKGTMQDANASAAGVSGEIHQLKKLRLRGGTLEEEGLWAVDPSLLDDSLAQPAYIVKGNHSWIIDLGSTHPGNGRWLLDIDGDLDVYDVARIPGNRLKVSRQESHFECGVDEVTALGQVFITLDRNL
ncbi:helix-turn-helix domain-containing protein [Rahnella sp. SL6]|uniref:Helix-turn-helix domain-containing protein n=1 Tax=Rahnella perminowiae TaxID=2816244 RepID=A0ABS6KZJ9_9GAMM|nr:MULTISPECIES: helix-turn-helix domain-containing protein [Rahnella]UJD87981.1 CI repressor [Rahnella aquatilis]MBU9809783.1 helix-turn-helix domain-containing protein [Rahnella perminowiae]MBU9827811.1 helix-turn-helix domain-containing protein [Rahnella perminowiae]MBU9835029.1 helix-turn-helix domain-containing protein [Rahnella perminowiae]MCR9002976.1 helix-turn-helix domain-containing protein [Rahnella perminowiae]